MTLSLPQIKSGYIDDAIHRGLAGLNAPHCVHRGLNWRVFRQRKVRSNSVVVIHVG
jgi:hypothetical protein